MPLRPVDGRIAKDVATEATRFGRLMRSIPVEKGAPAHPAMAPMLRAFRSVNRALAQRDTKGYVSLASQARMGREFQKVGAALLIRPNAAQAKRRTSPR